MLRTIVKQGRLVRRWNSTTAVSGDWLETSSDVPLYKNFINGEFVSSSTSTWMDVRNPATNHVVAKVPQSCPKEIDDAVQSASKAFESWSQVPVQQRQRVMLVYQDLIRKHTDELAKLVTLENGKTLADSRGDVFRGLEVVETACMIADKLMGETLGGIGANMDCVSYRQPLGVCAGIAPFNFPAMIPLWMFPVACASGNTFVMKPSEKTPGATLLLAHLAQEAGLPDGVLNVVHGGKDSVDAICDHEDIRAISFVVGFLCATGIMVAVLDFACFLLTPTFALCIFKGILFGRRIHSCSWQRQWQARSG